MTVGIYTGIGLSANTIVPIFALIVVGMQMKRRGEMNPAFLAGINLLVYRYALPMLLFVSVVNSKAALSAQWRIILTGWGAVLLLYFGALYFGRKMPGQDRGVFVQGVFRGNLAIVGLSLVGGVYGYGEWFAAAAVFAGAVALLMNVLAVICLTPKSRQQTRCGVLLKVLRNPLVLALLIAMTVKELQLPVPQMGLTFAGYLKQLTLPLALISTGAAFNIRGIFTAGNVAVQASIGRLFISPLVFVLLGAMMGLRHEALGVLYLMGATPAASAGYIMAKSLGANAQAAANIIAITVAFSLLTVAPVIAVFPLLGWI